MFLFSVDVTVQTRAEYLTFIKTVSVSVQCLSNLTPKLTCRTKRYQQFFFAIFESKIQMSRWVSLLKTIDISLVT